jgi:hypothetical protein
MAIFFTACEKVIDLKLDTGAPVIVIEGNFTDNNEIQTVSISQTIAFKDKNQMSPFTGAIVVLNEENGFETKFMERKPGIYTTLLSIYGTPGKKYTLTVKANNKTYTAVSIMPQPVEITKLRQTELAFFGNKKKFVQVNYLDPAGVPNYYNSRVFVNGVKRDLFYVESDRFNDGKPVVNTIFTSTPDLEIGDKVKIDFECIDANVFRYLFAITQISGNGGPPTAPANPDSNFSNGALGYFSACTSRTDSLVIK